MNIREYFAHVSSLSLEEYFGVFGEVEQNLRAVESALREADIDSRRERAVWMCGGIEEYPIWERIHIYSFLMKLCHSSIYVEKVLDEVLAADYETVGEYNKLSHYWQISSFLFTNGDVRTTEIDNKLAILYKTLKESFQGALGMQRREYIPLQERNKDIVFVFTSQMLGLGHAPTKTVLDRCYVLQKYLQKKVFIINTAMFMPQKGQAPFYELANGAYEDDLLDMHELEFKGEIFSFCQCKNEMPDLRVMQVLLQKIREQKPYYILHVGGSDICADICGMLVPQITISTVFSRIATSSGEYQLVDKHPDQVDLQVLEILGVEPQKVKQAMFTFSFKEQTSHFNRAGLGIWENYFVLAVVGWRLDIEVDDAFMKMLCQTLQDNEKLGVVFIGKFESYEQWVEKYPLLKEQSKNLGKQDDVLAVLECCDLYVNPRRNGGGSSVSEALFKGLPAVTLPMGDVSVAAGKEFHVADYETMIELILRYSTDEDFYKEMQKKARKRAELLLDSERSFGNAIKEIEAEIERNA